MTHDWILVLGANSDMAKAAARRFAQAGYNIYLASRNTKELDKEVQHLKLKYQIKTQTRFFDALDLSSRGAFYAGLDPKPAGAVLAFGILGDPKRGQNDVQHALMIIDTNFTGAVSILEIIAADFEGRRHGFIVGISSVARDRGRQSNYLYGSAKAGLSAYLSGLRHRLFPAGVQVLTVKPGFVGLDLPQRLTAQPEDVAERIYKGVSKNKSVVYVKPIWRLTMWIIINLSP